MPKAAGQPLKIVRVGPPDPGIKPVVIYRPDSFPHSNPPSAIPPRTSNPTAAHAVRTASDHKGAIDPRKMHDGNLN